MEAELRYKYMAPKNTQKSYTVFDIANFYINLSAKTLIDEKVPEGITNLKLQKILYFAQVANLAIYEESLFTEEIEAWKYGPVIKTVYIKFKKHKNDVLQALRGVKDITDEESITFLNGVWELFGKYSAGELINITHNHQPWKDAYEKGHGTTIEKNVLQKYYKNIFVLKDA